MFTLLIWLLSSSWYIADRNELIKFAILNWNRSGKYFENGGIPAMMLNSNEHLNSFHVWEKDL